MVCVVIVLDHGPWGKGVGAAATCFVVICWCTGIIGAVYSIPFFSGGES